MPSKQERLEISDILEDIFDKSICKNGRSLMLDKLLKSKNQGELIVFASRPNVGKTSLALETVYDKINNNNTVLYFSLDLGKEKLKIRLQAIDKDIGIQSIKNDNQIFNNKNLFIDETTYPSINNIKDQIKLLVNEQDIKLVVIDYLQLINDFDIKNKTITKQLKLLALELNIQIILLSQVKRRVEKRVNRRPILSDVKSHNSIEDHADTIIAIYREDIYKEYDEQIKEIKMMNENYKSEFVNNLIVTSELKILKSSIGSNSTIKMEFNKEIAKFIYEDYSHIISKVDEELYLSASKAIKDCDDLNE
ncbi:MAG: hypothetical protein DRG78_23840 [Epsilonproteobacteria bacterium]|nr:MAG: hypothetical protein DRG78_23840 [Campylobacterota bacterium]